AGTCERRRELRCIARGLRSSVLSLAITSTSRTPSQAAAHRCGIGSPDECLALPPGLKIRMPAGSRQGLEGLPALAVREALWLRVQRALARPAAWAGPAGWQAREDHRTARCGAPWSRMRQS